MEKVLYFFPFSSWISSTFFFFFCSLLLTTRFHFSFSYIFILKVTSKMKHLVYGENADVEWEASECKIYIYIYISWYIYIMKNWIICTIFYLIIQFPHFSACQHSLPPPSFRCSSKMSVLIKQQLCIQLHREKRSKKKVKLKKKNWKTNFWMRKSFPVLSNYVVQLFR